ncbi:chitin synthase-domain-containing protein [Radiomyces spectabilis]|uniref:chitin synthase-domain-containing protein n=1 Tax=Radiomyces spectabilis TaxID=64574 RepID=UPI00221EEEEF|nr:chitin synthase-domain-containing protein [Radiomyces spectabilis]KAI8371729.1 chitin synthase-domain-containing protein [Radiomyces spectabilis]
MRVAENYSYMRKPTSRRIVWVAFARLCTLIFPDIVLKYVGDLQTSTARHAWREKIAMCVIFLSLSALLCFWLEYISTLFCDVEVLYKYSDVFAPDSKYAAINGKAVNLSFAADSSWVAAQVSQYPHHDLSSMFPTFMMLQRSSPHSPYYSGILERCIAGQGRTQQADNWLAYRIGQDPGYAYENGHLMCPLPDDPTIPGVRCVSRADNPFNFESIGADILYSPKLIREEFNMLPSPKNRTKRGYVILNQEVLDVTDYLEAATNVVNISASMTSRAFALDRMFLPLDLSILLYINLGNDITDYFRGNTSDPDLYLPCLRTLFFQGITTDDPPERGCYRVNPALFATLGLGLLYFLIKMNLANLSRISFFRRYLSPSFTHRPCNNRNQWPYTIFMIPCYAEPAHIIKQTFDPLARTSYDDTKKLLVFVCDGVTQSQNETKPTYACILESLGHSGTEEALPQLYVSLGHGPLKVNRAKIYSGYYETGGNRVPYLVVVKIGHVNEIAQRGHAPGNRGKRDSMVMIFGFLERCMNLANNRMTPLEYELFNHCYSVLGIDPREFKYLLMTDADTQVQGDVLQKLVCRLENDRKMLAISGHVRPANPEENLITMLQIFPLHWTFFSGLAYETCLRSLMTINGSLVMYKIWTENLPPALESNEKPAFRWWFKPTSSDTTSQRAIWHSKWPKVSDEIIDSNPSSLRNTQPSLQNDRASTTTSGLDSRLSLSLDPEKRPCCIHPTVLRGFATPQADTMHMQNVLLQGEDRYLATVLLQSHPRHHLGFEAEAIGYATLPTTFSALQGLQVRNISAVFHNQLEMHRVSRHLGFRYWLLSATEIVNTIFLPSVIAYLYTVYIRFLLTYWLSYAIIAGSFMILFALHIVYFLLRRQFKYVMWFILYCLLSVPLFMVWFPILALWRSDQATNWYDVWASNHASGSRPHGAFYDHEESHHASEKEEFDTDTVDEDSVPRMRLGEYEAAEAHRSYRAAEVALDSKFTGFTSFGNARDSFYSTMSTQPTGFGPAGDATNAMISSFPPAQLRDNLSSNNLKVPADMYSTSINIETTRSRHRFNSVNKDNRMMTPAQADRAGSLSVLPDNPFADPLHVVMDNPFDDNYAISLRRQGSQFQNATQQQGTSRRARGGHRSNHSQSSYFTHQSYSSREDTVHRRNMDISPYATTNSRTGGRETDLGHARSFSADSVMNQDSAINDRASLFSVISQTMSLASSSLSIDPEASLEKSHGSSFIGQDQAWGHEQDEGRRTACHGNVGLKIPHHANLSNVSVRDGAMASGLPHRLAYHRAAPPAPPPVPSPSASASASKPLGLSIKRSRENAILNVHEFREAVRKEIRQYLQQVNLDLTTRSEVKDHLFKRFGQRIEQDETIQAFIHHCIENTTLEYLNQHHSP